MSKNLFLFLITALTTLCVGCSSDDDYSLPQEDLKVIKSDLLFEPLGRTGSAVVDAQGGLTVSLEADWCRAEVDGNTVNVTVDDNTGFDGRTAILAIHDGSRKVSLPVQQRGIALGSLPVSACAMNNNGGRLAFYLKHDLPVNLRCDEDWIHPSVEGDSIIVNYDSNPTWHVRRGKLIYECGGYAQSLSFAQYDINNILGTYYFGGTMGGASTGFRFKVFQEAGKYYMQFLTVDEWKDDRIPVDFDEGLCEFTFHSASIIHDMGDNGYDAFFFYDSTGAIATSESASMKATIYYNPFALGDSGSHYATLEDNGTWGGAAPLSGFVIRVVRPLVSTNLVQLANPYLVWLGS